MSIDAVVFDMDGVLIDSEVIWRRVREVYAAERGLRWSAEDQFALMGCSVPVWSARMRERLGITDLSAEALGEEILRRVRAAFATDVPLRPGAVQALQALGRRWPLAVATGSPRALAEQALARSGLRPHFRFVVCGDDVAEGKPHPAIYLRALQALGVAAPHAAGIEDSAHGLRALRNAGMWAIAAPGPEFPLQPDELALAHAVVHDLSDVTVERVEQLPRLRPH